MTDDTFLTIAGPCTGEYTEKRSKFIAHAVPVTSLDEIKEQLESFKKKYYDARHICYAYMLGPERTDFRANDNGEPSGTAGKPILGQINARNLTDLLVVVIRYFGGIKLGTGGLCVAYKTASSLALDEAEIAERIICQSATISFEYPAMNDVMRIVKETEATIVSQSYETDCIMELSIRKTKYPLLFKRLNDLRCITFKDDPQ